MSVEFRLLGVVEAHRDGQRVDLGGPRSLTVLAVLLLRPGQVIARDQVISRVWETPPPHAQELVAASVYRLREVLAPDAEQVQLRAVRGGFVVHVDLMAIDAHRFLALLGPEDTDTDAEWTSPDPERAARLQQALELWRGQSRALINVRSDWLRGQARILERRRLDALEQLARLELDAGRTREAMDLLRDVAPEPDQAGLTAVVIRALLGIGQNARAVELADTTSRALEQQKNAPGPALRAALDAAFGTRAGHPQRGPRRLPADTSLFTGRGDELAQLVALAERTGSRGSPGTVVIFAIDGMGGVGKSALAIRAGHRLAERFSDGQLFLDLHGFTQGRAPRDPADALATLLSSLGVPPHQIPAELDARAALYRDRLAGTRTLILLDNASDDAQVRPLLPASDSCLVLITSRTRLKTLDDAVPLPLDVLRLDAAVALLGKAARLPYQSADRPLLVQIAELCGRLPLALLIAGALLRTGGNAWNLSLLFDRLAARRPGQDLAGYTDETRSLAVVFDLSYRQLPEDWQLLFRRLGLLPGPEFDSYAAAALLDSDVELADHLLQRLSDHSLLSGTSPGRYRIHDLLRAYARTLAVSLDPEPERDAAVDRLLHYYAHTAQTASISIARYPRPTPEGPPPAQAPVLPDPDAAMVWLRSERSNLEAAYIHARTLALHAHAIALAAGLAEILYIDGPWTRALELHQTAAETAERHGRPAACATALTDLGRARYLTGDYPGTANAAVRALDIYRAIGHRLGEANTLTGLGRVWEETGDLPGATDALIRAMEIYRGLGHRHGEANALTYLGGIRQRTGDFPGATDALLHALEICREVGNRQGEAWALSNLGSVRQRTGDYPAATDALVRALEIYREVGHRHGEAWALNNLGSALQRTGDYPAATDALVRALEIYREVGYRHGEAWALTNLGSARQRTGDYPGATDALTDALEIYHEISERGNEAHALNHYAAALAATGDRSRALDLYQRALAMNRELKKPDDEATSLEGIADYHLVAADIPQGAAHLRQALEIYQRLGMRPDIERVRARLATLKAP